jgi:hypothetical protein
MTQILPRLPFLKVNRVVVTGKLGCDITLRSGVNVIKAEAYHRDITASNDCGKTTFTDLIKYGLGDTDRFDSGTLSEQIDELFLEIELNGTLLTIRRDLNKPGTRASFYRSGYNPVITLNDPDNTVEPGTPMSNFLLEELGMPRISVPQSNRPGANTITITLKYLLRLLYMDQKNSFQEIMNKVPDNLKRKLVEILLGISKEEIEELRLRIQALTDEIERFNQEITNIANFLSETDATNRTELVDAIGKATSEWRSLGTEISALKQSMRGSDGVTDHIRQQLISVAYNLNEYIEHRDKARLKVRDFERLSGSLLSDRDKTEKLLEAVYVLSSIPLTQCPRCLQKVTTAMRHREDDGHCMLCERPLRPAPPKTRGLGQDAILDDELKEVRILIEQYNADIDKLNRQIEQQEVKKKNVEEELDQLSRSYVSPFVDTLEQVLHQRNEAASRIGLLQRQYEQWDRLENKEIARDQLELQRKELEARVLLEDYDRTILRRLSDYYESFLRRVGYSDLRRAEISEHDFMPRVNGHFYTADSGSGMLAVKIVAYHYALLEYSINYRSNLPKFLMVDSPRYGALNSESYQRLLKEFLRLETEYADLGFQVILTTRDLPEDMNFLVVERLNSVNRMLLRPEGNRQQATAFA